MSKDGLIRVYTSNFDEIYEQWFFSKDYSLYKLCNEFSKPEFVKSHGLVHVELYRTENGVYKSLTNCQFIDNLVYALNNGAIDPNGWWK